MQTTMQNVLEGRQRYAALHGDCLDIPRRMPEGAIDACIIDPPYGMQYQGKNAHRQAIANDDRPFIWWLHDAFRLLKDSAALACFCRWKDQQDWRTAIRLAGFQIRSQVIWDRMQHGMGHPGATFAPRHDVIWFATKGRYRFPGGRPPTVLQHQKPAAKHLRHSTEKPLALMHELVAYLTAAGDVVYDPCMGSGSTGEAAVELGRRFIGIELDGSHCETARQRMRRATRRGRDVATKPAGGIHAIERMRAVA